MNPRLTHLIRVFVITMVACLCTAFFRSWALGIIEYFSWPDLPGGVMASGCGLALFTLLLRSGFKTCSTAYLLILAFGLVTLDIVIQLGAALVSVKYCEGAFRGPVSVILATLIYWAVAHLWMSVGHARPDHS